MGKKERIEWLERMLSGSNGEMRTYEPYQGVFADLEEHHSRLKAVEHDVPELIGELEALASRVGALECPEVELKVERFPSFFSASTAEGHSEQVPGVGEVTSEAHKWGVGVPRGLTVHTDDAGNVIGQTIEDAPDPEDAPPRHSASSAPSTEEWNTLTVDLAKAEARIKKLESRAVFWEESCREARAERNDLLDRRDAVAPLAFKAGWDRACSSGDWEEAFETWRSIGLTTKEEE